MPSSEEILRLCFTISEVPNAFDRDAVTSLVRKKRSSATVTKLETVPGGEADDRLSRWIVCLKSENDAEYFYTNIKEEEIETDEGQWCTVKYLQTTECEIPGDWLEDMDDDDLESNGDPPPVPSEKPKKSAGHHPPYPSLDQARPFAQSGFYHNIPTSMPGQPGSEAPAQHSQGAAGRQGPLSGFQQPYFFPHMGPQSEPQEEAGPPTKIRVTNLPDMVEEDFLEMFFEKLGGRQVAGIELDSDKNKAIVEFEEHEAVEIVLEKQPVKCKGKILQIEVYAPESATENTKEVEETDEELPTKILVSDIPPSEADEESLIMFFENTKKFGGGPVTNIEINEEEGVAIVEFEDQEAVQTVLEKQSKQPILLANTEIRVEAYVPEKVRDIAEDPIGGEGDTVKIVVTNIPEKAMDEDYLEMFFEKKGDIASVELFGDYAAAVIEFVEPEGVEKVLSKQPVKMFKVEVDVKPLSFFYVPRVTVEVRGEELDEDILEMYFEHTKKSGGGPIEKLELNEEEEVAYITYENETVARRVVDKGLHVLDAKQLTVSLHEPPDPLLEFLKRTAGATDPEPEQTTLRTIKIRGMKKVKSRETVQYYFENSRQSGGGQIAEMKIDEEDDNVAFIRFESAEAAKKVSERASHHVDNCELSVLLYKPPPPRSIYEEKLLIKGIKPTTTKDCLLNFLEAKGGVIPECQQQGEKDNVRLVTFQAPIDFDKLKQNAHTLEGASLQLERVDVSNCVYVANYDKSMGKDTLELYFESETKSGGGQVEKVVCVEDEGYWLIYFADYQVIDNVLHRKHKLGQNKLVVRLFIDCLGRTSFKIPDPVFVPDPNTKKIKFILNSKTSKDAIENQMSSCHTKVHWPETDAKPPLQIKLECTLTQKTKNCYKLSKEWKKNSLDNFKDYMKTIVLIKNSVRKELWSDVVKTLQDITIDNPDAVAVCVENEQGNVTIVGIKRPAKLLSGDIKQRIKKINEVADLPRQRVKEPMASLNPPKSQLTGNKEPRGEASSQSLFKELFAKTKNKTMFEGRIQEIDTSVCENAIRNVKPFDGGGYGDVYLVRPKDNTEMSIVIKRIQCKDDAADEKLMSATCEVLAARIMHFGIVPLWASNSAEDTSNTTIYFILPYMENKSLAEKLKEDKKAIESNPKGKLTLDIGKRLRILYQVACALAFLHEEIPMFRGSYVHRDVTTRNIVLDSKFNARLVDFGLAREYTPGKDGVTWQTSYGSKGYFQTYEPDKLTVGKDVFNFGIVILEVLSSHPPCWLDHEEIELRNKLDDGYFIEDLKTHIQFVWGSYTISDKMAVENDDVKKLMQIATNCRKETITSAEMRNQLEGYIRKKGFKHWKDPQAGRVIKTCVICLINPVMQDAKTILAHNEDCNLHVCAACMRNSYLNPIECHSCAERVQPTIGHQWEAILVAGNDVDEKKSAVTFKKDVDKVFKAITSRHPMAMGISENSVHCVCADKPGTSQPLLPNLEEKFNHVAEQKIHSLLFYFTGHHDTEKGFKLGDNDEHLTSKELEKYIGDAVKKSDCKRVLVLLDCCEAPDIKLDFSCLYYQINSCSMTQSTKFSSEEGSLMTEFFAHTLKGQSMDSEKPCLLQQKQKKRCQVCMAFTSDNGFIKIEKLQENVQRHVNKYDEHVGNVGNSKHQIRFHTKGNGWEDSVFAYFIDTQITFEFILQHRGPNNATQEEVKLVVKQLPDKQEDLEKTLFIIYRDKFHLSKLKPENLTGIIAITFYTGPRESNKHELNTMGMIEAAWNAKRKLCVCLREIQYIHRGKVGVFVEQGVASAVLKCFDNEDVNRLCERSQQGSTVLVICRLERDGARKLWRAVHENAYKDGATCNKIWKDFEKQLEAIRDNKMIEGKGKLVFTFPEKDEDENQITSFYSIHVEM